MLLAAIRSQVSQEGPPAAFTRSAARLAVTFSSTNPCQDLREPHPIQDFLHFRIGGHRNLLLSLMHLRLCLVRLGGRSVSVSFFGAEEKSRLGVNPLMHTNTKHRHKQQHLRFLGISGPIFCIGSVASRPAPASGYGDINAAKSGEQDGGRPWCCRFLTLLERSVQVG